MAEKQGLAAGRPKYSISNMFQLVTSKGFIAGVLPKALRTSAIGWDSLSFMFMWSLGLAIIYIGLHHLLLRASKQYRFSLTEQQQFITCQHAVFVVVYALQLVPESVLAFRFLFMRWSPEYLTSVEPAALLGLCIFPHVMLYIVEATVRSIVKFNWVLVVHHMLFFTLIIVITTSFDFYVVKLGCILDAFALHEVLLFATLVGYRLKWNAKFVRATLAVGIVWYCLTRVVQTVLILWLMIGCEPGVRLTAGFIITAIVACALTLVQVYTLFIYKGVWVKLTARQAAGGLLQGEMNGKGGQRDVERGKELDQGVDAKIRVEPHSDASSTDV